MLDKQPKTLNTDKHASYAHAIALLKKRGLLRKDVKHRQVKFLPTMALNQIMHLLRNSLSLPVDLKYKNVHGQQFRDLNHYGC